MKKIIYLLVVIGSLISLGACEGSEYELENTIPNKFHKILYLKNSGKQQVTLFNTGQTYHYTFSVIKAGSDPNLEANVDVSLLTQEQVDNQYSQLESINYKIIATDTYSFDATHLNFLATDNYKTVDISLNPEKISELMESDPTAVWVLPLQITSKTDSINANRKELFLELDVRGATVGFKEAGSGEHEIEYGRIESSINYNAIFKLDTDNQWDLVCDFEAEGQAYVEAYNSKNGTSYELLPEGSYSFAETLKLPTSVSEAVLRITVNGDKVKELAKENLSGNYILPVRIKSVNLFEVSATNNIYAVTIRVTPKLNRANWTIEASSEELNGSKTWEGPAKNMLDGDLQSFWENQWKAEPAPKPVMPYTLIIDTKAEHTFIKFFMQQRQNIAGVTKNGDFEVSSDKNSWTKVGTFDMTQAKDIQAFHITRTKGRYIKITVRGSYSNPSASLSEFYVYGE